MSNRLARTASLLGSQAALRAVFERLDEFRRSQGTYGRASGGTNLGPNNPKLVNGSADFAGIRQLAEEYRQRNGLAPDAPIPIDAVTRSGSGLDPHISLANALLQVPRVARARDLIDEVVRRLVTEHLEGRQLGFMGNPRVSVLELNLAWKTGDRRDVSWVFIEGQYLLPVVSNRLARTASLLGSQAVPHAVFERLDEFRRSQRTSRVRASPEGQKFSG